jgi:hypothetical protein
MYFPLRLEWSSETFRFDQTRLQVRAPGAGQRRKRRECRMEDVHRRFHISATLPIPDREGVCHTILKRRLRKQAEFRLLGIILEDQFDWRIKREIDEEILHRGRETHPDRVLDTEDDIRRRVGRRDRYDFRNDERAPILTPKRGLVDERILSRDNDISSRTRLPPEEHPGKKHESEYQHEENTHRIM